MLVPISRTISVAGLAILAGRRQVWRSPRAVAEEKFVYSSSGHRKHRGIHVALVVAGRVGRENLFDGDNHDDRRPPPPAVQNHHFRKMLLDAASPGAGVEVVTSAPGGAKSAFALARAGPQCREWAAASAGRRRGSGLGRRGFWRRCSGEFTRRRGSGRRCGEIRRSQPRRGSLA